MVTNPQNVFIMRDIACAGYVAGGNCDFFYKHGISRGLGNAQETFEDMKSGFTNRLDADPNGEKTGSMFAFPLDPMMYEQGKMDTCLSLTDRHLPWSTGGGMSTFPSGDALGGMYKNEFGLNTIHHGEDPRAVQNHEYTSQGSHNNSLCFLGPHRVYSSLSSTGDKMELVPGQGAPRYADRHPHTFLRTAPRLQCLTTSRPSGPPQDTLDQMPCLGCARGRFEPPNRRTAATARSRVRYELVPLGWQDARWRRGEVVSLKASRETITHATDGYKFAFA